MSRSVGERNAKRRVSGNHEPETPPPEPDRRAALDRVLEMMAIGGTSGEESVIVEYITDKLRGVGVPASAILVDQAHRRTKIRGQVGNLVCRLPGTFRGPRRLLMAHVDTVPLCVGSKPVLKNGWVRSADPNTGLGADDRAGAAVVLTAAIEILRHKLPHPPLTFFWPVQEEVGLQGVRYAKLSALGKPRLAFNFDGGAAEKVTIGATGAYRLQIRVEGLASHAGGAPQHGVSAVAIAALAIAEMTRDGWHGAIQKSRSYGTSNVGFIHGGGATNVVTDTVELRAEARSHDPAFRRQIVTAIERCFKRAAKRVKNVEGTCGRIKLTSEHDYESFKLNDRQPCILDAEAAIRDIGLEPLRTIANGGLDANWMADRGIPTVTLGCGQHSPHTVDERLDVAAYQSACRIGLRLATATVRR